jgi:hypothetical protein
LRRIITFVFFCSLGLPAYTQWALLSDVFVPNISITAYDSTVIAGISYGGFFDLAVSYDAGNSWSGENPLEGFNGVTGLYAGNSWVYACTENGVYRADKDSLNWALYNQGLPAAVFDVIERDSIVLAFHDNRLFIRGLEDSLWSVLSDNIPQEYITGFDFDGTLIAVAGSNGVCESYDMGASWSLWTNPSSVTGIIVIKGDTIIHASPGGVTMKLISTGYRADVSNGLTKLWTPPPGWDYYGTFEQFHKIGDNIFLCGETGVYKLKDNAWYWELTGIEYTEGLADNGDKLFAVRGYSGIWGRPLDQLIVNTIDDLVLPYSISIYPNPANDLITVRSDRIIEEISVYDHLGRQVYNADPENKILNLEIRDYTPGLYFICCSMKEVFSVKKMIISH